MNVFIASDEHILYMLVMNTLALEMNAFELEMNTLALETNALKMLVRPLATHTASYQRLPNRIYVEMIAIVTATYL